MSTPDAFSLTLTTPFPLEHATGDGVRTAIQGTLAPERAGILLRLDWPDLHTHMWVTLTADEAETVGNHLLAMADALRRPQ